MKEWLIGRKIFPVDLTFVSSEFFGGGRARFTLSFKGTSQAVAFVYAAVVSELGCNKLGCRHAYSCKASRWT